MNRFKKEEARAQKKAREGLTDAEIKLVDEQDALNKKVSGIAKPFILSGFPKSTTTSWTPLPMLQTEDAGLTL